MTEPFNTYTIDLDLQYVHELCKREGEIVSYQRGQLLEREGEPAHWIGFVEQGCFKYCKRDFNGNDEHTIGFVFEGEFVCDIPTASQRSRRPFPLRPSCRAECPCFLVSGWRHSIAAAMRLSAWDGISCRTFFFRLTAG